MSVPTGKGLILAAAGVVLLSASIAVAALAPAAAGAFPWGIHMVTIPGVALLGLVAGWFMRDKQAAEERARAEIEGKR